jgi:hypothetical protein
MFCCGRCRCCGCVHAVGRLRKQNTIFTISTYLEFVISKLSCDASRCFVLLQPQRLLRLRACDSAAAETKRGFENFDISGIRYFKAFL